MNARRRGDGARPPAGFALVMAVALMVLVESLIELANRLLLASAQSTTIEKAEIMADYLAETGLMRTAAYLMAMGDAEPDFDEALDPMLDTTCAWNDLTSGAITMGGTQTDDHLPRLAGGTADATPSGGSGLYYQRFEYGGGAYFIRIDDNSDDGHEGWNCPNACTYYSAWNRNNYFRSSTNNHDWYYSPGYYNNAPNYQGGIYTWGPTCPEAASPEINQLRDNPVRDRDKLVMVTAIGIYPGNSFAGAMARRSYRLLMGPMRQKPVIAAAGSVTLGSGVKMCGYSGGVHSNGSITVGGSGCQCGDFTAVGSITAGLSGCSAAECPTWGSGSMCIPATSQSGFQSLTFNPLNDGTNTFAARDKTFMNNLDDGWGGFNYFYLSQNGIIYFYDQLRPAEGGKPACNLFSGDTNPAKMIPKPCGPTAAAALRTSEDATHGDDEYCHCWIPVFYGQGPGTAVPNPYRNTSPGVCPVGKWCPNANYGDQAANWMNGDQTTCDPLNDCFPNAPFSEWRPSNRSYDWMSRMGMWLPANPLAHAIWKYDNAVTGGVRWTFTDLANYDTGYYSVYYVEGAANEIVMVPPLAADAYSNFRIVTPSQVQISDSGGLVNYRYPAWLTDNYIIVSTSTANSIFGSASCYVGTGSVVYGQILCQGRIGVYSNELYGSIISTGSSVGVGSNVKLQGDESLSQWITISVVPAVWADATF